MSPSPDTPGAMHMKNKTLVVVALLLSCGSALAGEQKFDPVQVRAQAADSLAISCDGAGSPNAQDVEQVLGINDRSQTSALRSELMGAVGEACNAGFEHIAVQRGVSGRSVTWAPATAASANVALRLSTTSVASN